MGYNVGIIPAAGKAQRFGGTMKELLPARDGVSLLVHAVKRLSLCQAVVVITNPDKIAEHAKALANEQVIFIMQRSTRDILGAILSGMEVKGDRYYFTMPDTWMRPDVFLDDPGSTFALGVFDTDKPERFGIVRNGWVVNKAAGNPGQAWGVLAWDKSTRVFWDYADTYTSGINTCMAYCDYRTWNIGDYFDNASVNDYIGFLNA